MPPRVTLLTLCFLPKAGLIDLTCAQVSDCVHTVCAPEAFSTSRSALLGRRVEPVGLLEVAPCPMLLATVASRDLRLAHPRLALDQSVDWARVEAMSADARLEWLADTLGMPSADLAALRPLSFASVNDEACVVECRADEGERSFLCGHPTPVRVRELAFSEGSFGSTVWPSSLILGEWLATEVRLGKAPSEILELGAGVGLAGLAAAAQGASVTSTDLEDDDVGGLLSNLRHNAKLNGLQMECARLDWRDTASWLDRQYDLVVGSDLLYYVENAAPLAQTLAHHVAPGGTAVLVSPAQPRGGVTLDEVCDTLVANLPEGGQVEQESCWLRRSSDSTDEFRFVRWLRQP